MRTLSAAPARANGRVDVVTGLTVVDGAAPTLDLYLPQGRGPWPATVYLHCPVRPRIDRTGPNGRTGPDDDAASRARPVPDDHAARCRGLARHGVAVASASCRPGGGRVLPTQVRDATAVVRWVQRHGERYGLTTQAIGAWGVRVGGQLAAFLGTGGDTAVMAVAVLLPPASPSPATPTAADGRHPARVVPGCEAHESAAARLGRVPFLLVHAVPGARFAKPSALRFRTMLVRRGQRGRLPLVPGDEHDDPCLGSDAALSTIAAFFREHLA